MHKKTILIVLISILVFIGIRSSSFSIFTSKVRTVMYSGDVSRVSKSEMLNKNRIKIDFNSDFTPKIIIKGLSDDNSLKSIVNGIVVDVDKEVDIGLSRFMPLIKIIRFSSEYAYCWCGDVYIDSDTIPISGNSKFHIDGKMKIYGICSGKEAEKLIMNDIHKKAGNKISEEIRDRLKTLSHKRI